VVDSYGGYGTVWIADSILTFEKAISEALQPHQASDWAHIDMLAFHHIVQVVGYIFVNTGAEPDAKEITMDIAAYIACGACCVAASKMPRRCCSRRLRYAVLPHGQLSIH
jgi:hypothetical protein